MSTDPAVPALEVAARRVGTRPHALVRSLTRATLALVTTGLSALTVLSLIYPQQSMAPRWAVVPVGLALMASVATAAAALAAQLACWIGPLARGRLAVTPAGVAVTGLRDRFIARDDIDAAWILHEPQSAQIELRLRNGDVFNATTTPEAATAVLDAAGVDAARRALRMPLGSAAATLGLTLGASLPASCLAAVLGDGLGVALHIPSAVVGFLIIGLFAAFVLAAVLSLAPPAVAVGSDGLSVGEGRRAWFVTFDEVVAATHGPGAITLHLRDGRLRRISTLGTSEARRAALHARIATGLEAARAPLDLSARLAALDRNGLSAADWGASLRRLADARDGYRQTKLSRDEVQSALEDPRSSPERRIGAAFTLAAMDAGLAGTRVRVVAETVAHEPVRIALEQAAAGELDEAVLDAAREGQERG